MADTTSTISQVVGTYYAKRFLDRLESETQLYKFCEKKPIPKNGGNTIQWARFANFSADTTPTTEGTVGSATALSASNVTASISEYANYVVPSSLVEYVAVNSVIDQAVDLLSYQAELTIEKLVRAQLDATTAQIAAGCAAITDLASTDTLKFTEIRKAVRTLGNASARPHKLTPGYFVGIFPYSCSYDLKGDTATQNWVEFYKYTDNDPLKRWRLGKIGGVEAFETPLYTTAAGSGSVSIYNSYIFGDGVVGAVELAGKTNPEIIIKPVGSAGSADPCNQLSSVGYKIWMAAKVLESARGIYIRTQVSG